MILQMPVPVYNDRPLEHNFRGKELKWKNHSFETERDERKDVH